MNEEQRKIGGARVLLVRKYDGSRAPKPPKKKKRAILERRLSPPRTADDQDEPNDTVEEPAPSVLPTILGFGGAAVAVVGGLWLYVQNGGSTDPN